MTGRKKIFSLVFGITVIASGLLFFTRAAFADHLVPPPEAQCEPLGGIAHNYACTGEPVGVLVSIVPYGSGNLIAQCRNTGGVTLRYGFGPPRDNYYLRCLGSQNERIFKIGGVEVSTTKGILNNEVQKEQERLAEESRAVMVAQSKEESCKALDWTCELFKTVGTFFSNIWKGFLETVLGFFAAAFGALFSGVALMVNGMIGWLMNLTVNPGNPSTTTIVQVGWKISRDLVNLLFLIVLVFIGLATILRLQTYEMKKTLPLLLVMALLINFSGVLVGLVVDTGNIITQFFLQGSQGATWESALEWPGRVMSVGDMTTGQIIAGNLVQIAYSIIATFIFLTLLAIFFIRVFVLWTLAIIAPFAFAAYILPATRSIWTKWLSQLIQWSFVGVPIAFFMLFANLAIIATKEKTLAQDAPFLTEFLGPFAALFFLFVGIGTAITMAPAGANKVMALGKQYGTKAVKGSADFARSQGRKWLVGQEKKDKDRQDRIAQGGTLTRRERIGAALSSVVTKPARWGYRTFGTTMPEVSIEKEREARVAALEKKYGKEGAGEAAKAYSSLMTPEARMAHALYIAKTGGQKGWGALREEGHEEKAVQTIARLAPDKMKDIAKADMGILDEKNSSSQIVDIVQNALIPNGTNTDEKGDYKDKDIAEIAKQYPNLSPAELIQHAVYKKAVDAMTPADLEKADKKLLENKMFRQMVVRYKPMNFIRKIADEWGRDTIGELKKEAEGIGIEEITKTNSSFVGAALTPWGKQFIGEWQDPKNSGKSMSDDRLKEFIRSVRESGTPKGKPLEGALTQQEDDFVSETIRNSASTDNPLSYQEATSAYNREYGDVIRKQLGAELPGLTAVYGASAETEGKIRMHNIYEAIQVKRTLPKTPRKITAEETWEFSQMAERGELPDPKDKQAWRKFAGIAHATMSAIEKIEKSIAKDSLEMERLEKSGDIDGMDIQKKRIEKEYKNLKNFYKTMEKVSRAIGKKEYGNP